MFVREIKETGNWCHIYKCTHCVGTLVSPERSVLPIVLPKVCPECGEVNSYVAKVGRPIGYCKIFLGFYRWNFKTEWELKSGEKYPAKLQDAPGSD